ncbi:MAG: hypothetical protein IJ814_03200 [Paludibacteraceae bacterium]|nr:hypothetical protein [Paludibacteraceae bacterium]
MKKLILSVLVVLLCVNWNAVRAENIGVPAECEDVMLQAFYWDSYKTQTSTDSKYGRTKWIDLLKDTAAINANFDLVWFPPSAWAGDDGGVGYYHRQASNQDNTFWGTKNNLVKLITALHAGNTKVLADIVINHRNNKSSWVNFYTDNFGTYGTFTLKQEHICSGDEAFTSSDSPYKGSTTHGAADTGTNDGGCRDLDHSNEYVQSWAKAYVQWMLNVMNFDGFRYDMTLGYHGKYLSMYNEAANPYFSVSECWSDINTQVNHLKATNYNTLIFDFPLKYVINNALGVDGSSGATRYNLLKNPTNSLRNKGYKRYAVTFIDNHDTFERSDNQSGEFIKYNANLGTADVKRRIMEANAYILMLPGVPCVFYPHWSSYKDEINALIAVRKKAGIHSESEIEETSTTSLDRLYEATVYGHRGTVILRMGVNRSKEAPEGYEQVLDGGEYGNYTIFYREGAQGVESVTANGRTARGEKFVKDGKLYIRMGERVYDVLGNKVNE